MLLVKLLVIFALVGFGLIMLQLSPAVFGPSYLLWLIIMLGAWAASYFLFKGVKLP